MPIFTAIAAAVTGFAATVGFGAAAASFIGGVAAFAARTLLTIGIAKLVSNRSGSTAAGSQDVGARIQLPPATDNKLPVVYGSAFISGSITDAKLSSNNKTMWYVIALAEHTNTTGGSGYTFNKIYYDNKEVTFDGTDPAKVISLTTNTAGTPQVDTKIAGNLFIYLFTNGSNSGVNTGGLSAIDIMSDSAIPSDQRWTSSLYTSGGQSADMTNTCFAIVKVLYNQEAGTTNLGSLTFQLTNSLSSPGSVIKDYLVNTRYGCAIPVSRIDTASLTALDTYSSQLITYVPVGGGSATQARYRINGPLNTGLDCLTNLQQLVDACDSWLQYSELTGQWKVVINRSYTDYTTLGNLYSVTSSNLIGGIEVNPIDLNSTYNEMEVQYPNANIKDQTDFQVISLFTSYPNLLSPNEAVNRLTIQYPQVNNAVQAKYLGLRRLLQGREDLVISFATDYSGIQVDAGDVIKVTLSQYGWTDKLFRVSYVGEEKYGDGSLGARLTAFEYNDSIYADNSIQDFVPADNTGLTDPNVIGTPLCPVVTLNVANTIASMTVVGTVPTVGQVMYMDFNYGNTSNSLQHVLFTSVSGNGTPLTANSNVSITATSLPAGDYWWSVTAKNDQVGARSNSCANVSNVANYPGPAVTTWDPTSNTGGITNNNIANNTITGSKIANNTITGNKIANYTIQSNNLSNTGVSAGIYASATITVGIDGRVTNISNGTPGISGINVQDEGNLILANATTLNFTGPFINASNVGNVATITVGGTMAQPLGGQNFSIRNFTPGGNSILPVNVTSTATRNIPVYIIGTGVSSLNVYPWYQATANASFGSNGNNYYGANSTGIWLPSDAAGLFVDDGEDNWYTILVDNSMAGNLSNTDTYNLNMGITVVSDSNGTIIQVVEGLEFNNDGYFQFYTDQLHTMTLFANQPQTFVKTKGFASASLSNTTRSAVAIRNMTDGANVTVVQGSLASSKIPYWPYF